MNKILPPAPPGWNKTISDLLAEAQRGERSSVGSPEVDWARDYERSLIPIDMRFPRKGDVYEATKDVTVNYMTAWAAPYTGGELSTLKAGERVVIQDPVNVEPISVYAQAVDYSRLEQRIVPLKIRSDPKYAGFYFSLKTVDLNRHFKLLHEEKV